MCGESAGDIIMIPFLLAAGLDEFSMSPSNILVARKAICSLSKANTQKELEKLLTMETEREIYEHLKSLSHLL